MSLGLAKNSTPTYDYYSSGDGSDPIPASALLTNAGGTVNSGTATMYLVATTFRYTGITLALTGEQSGIDWKLSLAADGPWTETVEPADMNALVSDAVIPVYAKFVADNNGTVPTNLYTGPDVTWSGTEEPV